MKEKLLFWPFFTRFLLEMKQVLEQRPGIETSEVEGLGWPHLRLSFDGGTEPFKTQKRQIFIDFFEFFQGSPGLDK